MLEFDVAELVDGADLPQHPTLVGISEEGHHPPGQATLHSQPTPCDDKRPPSVLEEPKREST